MANTAQTTSQKSWYKRNEVAITPWLFLIPGIFMFSLYVVFPILQSFNISFYKWNGLGSLAEQGKFIGFDNYEKLIFRDRKFEISLWNNAKWLILYLAAMPAGLLMALFLNQTVTGIRVYKSLFFFPFVISQIVVGLVFTWFYDPQFGLFNGILMQISNVFELFADILRPIYFVIDFIVDAIQSIFGLYVNYGIKPILEYLPDSMEPIWAHMPVNSFGDGYPTWIMPEWSGLQRTNILGNPTTATYGIILAGLWPQTAYCMILYLTGLNAVDPEQVEAARLDGAKGHKMLWYVIIPQLKPATFIAFVVTIIGSLRSFDLIAIMTNGGPFGGSTTVLSFYMFEKSLGEYGLKMGYAAAIAVVLFLIMLVFIGYFLWSMYQEEKGAK